MIPSEDHSMLHTIRTAGTLLGLVALVGLVLVTTGCSDSTSSSGGGSTANLSVKELIAKGDMTTIGARGVGAKDELIVLLDDPDANIRVNAAGALGRLKGDGASAIPAILKAMKHDAGRPNMTYAITDMGKDAVPYLVTAIGSSDPTLIRYGTQILGTGGYGKEAKDAVDPLTAILKSDADDEVKTHAVMALASIGTAATPSIPAIQAVAATATGTLKRQADGAIRRINDAHKPGQFTEKR